MVKINKAFFLAVFFVISAIFIGVIASKTFSQDTPNFSNLVFATHENAIKFFDPSTGKVYVYSEFDGKLSAVWQLESIGKNLKKVY